MSRWAVHLGLLISAVASLGTLQLLHVRMGNHTVVGLVFVGLVVVHLAQRRLTILRMSTQECTHGTGASGSGTRRSGSGPSPYLRIA